jgi:hypothetical protein
MHFFHPGCIARRFYSLDILINIDIRHKTMEWQLYWWTMSKKESFCLNVVCGAMAIFGTRLTA